MRVMVVGGVCWVSVLSWLVSGLLDPAGLLSVAAGVGVSGTDSRRSGLSVMVDAVGSERRLVGGSAGVRDRVGESDRSAADRWRKSSR